jgi:CRP-like cAMP-binding protein
MNASKQIQQYLQAFQLEDIFNENIMPYLTLIPFEQGENICRQGEPASMLYFLVKGKLKIYQNTSEGKTLILSFKRPLDVIGDIEYVQQINTINTVEAVTEVTFIGVPYEMLRKYTNDHAPLLHFLLKAITEKFYLKSTSMSLNIMYPVEVRLASYLLSITSTENISQIKNSNITDIANLIGTSYRHLNRVLLKFCNEGMIERKDKVITIKDRGQLVSLAGSNIYE